MRQPLNFGWSFVDDYKEEYLEELPSNKQEVDIPHSVILLPPVGIILLVIIIISLGFLLMKLDLIMVLESIMH